MFHQIGAQLALKRGPDAAQRQLDLDRLSGFGLHGKAVTAVDLRQIQRDDRLALGHAEIVAGAEGLDQLAIGTAFGSRAERDAGRIVRLDGDPDPARADVQIAAPLDPELRAARILGRQGSADILTDLAILAVKAQADRAAFGQVQHLALGQIVEIDRGLAGIGWRLGPALPAQPVRNGLGLRPRRALWRKGGKALPELPGAAEQKRHGECGQPDQPQPIGIAPAHPGIGGDGPRLCRTFRHLRLMRPPERAIAAQHGFIGKRRQRTPRQHRIDAAQRRIAGRATEPERAPDKCSQQNQPAQDQRIGPRGNRQGTDRPEAERGKRQQRQRGEGPEGTRQRFPPQPGASQRQGAGKTPVLLVLGHGPALLSRHPAARNACRQGIRADQNQSGKASREIISSSVGRGRIMAKRSPSTSTSGISGRELYSEDITAP